MGIPFAVDDSDDLENDCHVCKGKRLLEQWPDRKYLRCFNCPYKDQVKKAKEKHGTK
jgi:hypothetical protein